MNATPRQHELTEQKQRRFFELKIKALGIVCTVDEYIAECKRRQNGEAPQLDNMGRKCAS
jgi:hypothetical protein